MFWIGDLNYRINHPDEIVRQKIEEKDYETLLGADQVNLFHYLITLDSHHQLSIEKQKGKIFQDWQEGTIAFAPTYKYDSNSQEYDTSEKVGHTILILKKGCFLILSRNEFQRGPIEFCGVPNTLNY